MRNNEGERRSKNHQFALSVELTKPAQEIGNSIKSHTFDGKASLPLKYVPWR